MRCAVATILLASLAGCATQRTNGTTWGEDAEEGIAPGPSRAREEARGAAQPLARTVTIGSRPDSQGSSTQSSPEELELAILRFTSKRRAIAADQPPPAHSQAPAADSRAPHVLDPGDSEWPRPMQSAWDTLLTELESGFSRPRGTLPRRVLIQARVTIEVELDMTERRYGRAPQSILDRVGRIFGAIALHMRASPPLREERASLDDIALSWPVAPVIVTSPFGYRRDPILGRTMVRFHAGVDLGGQSGDVVHAAGSGQVVSTGWLGGHGRTVVLQHPGGYQTIYAHLKRIIAPIGAEVDVGSPLGFVGSSGRSTGPHLHFEVRRGGVPIDPLEVLDTHPSTARASGTPRAIEKNGRDALARAR